MLTLIPITYNPFKSFGMLSSIKSAKVAVHPILPIYRGISNFRLANTMAKKKLGMTRVPYLPSSRNPSWYTAIWK